MSKSVKKCVICGVDFTTSQNAKVCSKQCAQKRKIIENRIYHQKNKERTNKQRRDYYSKNREKVLAKQKVYREQNSLSEEQKKLRRQRGKESHKKQIQERLKKGEQIRGYNLNPKDSADSKTQTNERRKQRYKEDELFALTARVRALVNGALRKKSFSKSLATEKYLGCDFLTLKKHLEANFKVGMSWENREKWHIDHIVPISRANNEEEFILLSNYKNLQPLWIEENLKKSNRLGFEGVTSSISKKYTERGNLQQYRYGQIVEFKCLRCQRPKKSKLIAILNEDWENVMCNGCYGNILNKSS